jgi:hypothetical protein
LYDVTATYRQRRSAQFLLGKPRSRYNSRMPSLARPSRRLVRRLGGAVLITVALVLVMWALPIWLTNGHFDKHADRVKAQADARGNVLTLLGGVGLLGGLAYTARTFRLNEATSRLQETGQVTDRYTKAVEQVGSSTLAVRVGGIYALERIAVDSVRDHRTVVEVLSTFIRDGSHSVDRSDASHGFLPADVQAALTVLGRLPAREGVTRGDLFLSKLHRAGLSRANLSGAHLSKADLSKADLSKADLTEANLTGANLTGANLTEANLIGANLTGADLTDANLTGAILDEAKLAGATLNGAVGYAG